MTLLSNRTKWMLLAGLVSMLAAGTAAAQSNPASCQNDDDCVATPQCGGDVCEWPAQVCKPAGSAAKGADGWCTDSSDCKCAGMGATCVGAYCSFTRACDAPGGTGCATGGTGGGGGSTGTAGTSGGGSSDGGGCSVGATAPAAGSALIVALGLLGFSRRRRR